MRLKIFVSVVPVVLLTFGAAQLTQAAPTARCRSLATQFGEKPDALELNELAKLRTCVSDELSSKMESRRPPPPMSLPPPPPPRPPVPAPAPPSK